MGRLVRYARRAESLGFGTFRPALNLFGLGRREQLKLLRSEMSMTRREMRRSFRRIPSVVEKTHGV